MNDNEKDVRIVGVEIPFGNLVILLIELALAAIPATIILSVLGVFIATVAILFFGGK